MVQKQSSRQSLPAWQMGAFGSYSLLNGQSSAIGSASDQRSTWSCTSMFIAGAFIFWDCRALHVVMASLGAYLPATKYAFACDSASQVLSWRARLALLRLPPTPAGFQHCACLRLFSRTESRIPPGVSAPKHLPDALCSKL